MKKIELSGMIYSYELTKSRRKSLAINIKPDGTFGVKAPLFITQREIEEFIKRKEEWILKTIDRIGQQYKIAKMEFVTGEILPFLGKKYTLILEEGNRKRSSVFINELSAEIILKTAEHAAPIAKKAALESWYRVEAKEILQEKTAYFAQILKVSYGDIRIKDQKSIWGSCSAKGNLNFNWRIIMAPEEVLDYLVIHELSHRLFMNHSKDFWQCVEKIQPNYKYTRKWLKSNSTKLKMHMN